MEGSVQGQGVKFTPLRGGLKWAELQLDGEELQLQKSDDREKQ